MQTDQLVQQQVIDFDSDILFKQIPKMIKDRFAAQVKMLVKENQKITEHYYIVYNCLEGCLGDLLYDLLLMFVVMFRSLSVTPFVATNRNGFEVRTQKDPVQFTATLVTQMLWFLQPKTFS
jgi:hypothetical protein